MTGRRAAAAKILTSADPVDVGEREQSRSERRSSVLALLHQTIEDVAESGRDPDVGYVVQRGRGLFGRASGPEGQIRGWVFDSVRRRDPGGRSGRTYHAVLENGLFVISTSGSGLITESDYEGGRKLGSKSFGYVNFAAGYVHFNTTREAILLLKQMRTAFDLPGVGLYYWPS